MRWRRPSGCARGWRWSGWATTSWPAPSSGRDRRLVLAGHLDTVPPVDGNEEPRIVGDTLYGVGAADMKGGLAVFLHLAGTIPEPAVDVTWCFYACEEVEQRFNGLRQLWEQRPDLLEADAAILGEPTGGVVEAGCQGTMRARITMAGRRAHTARPATGRNAIHRLAPVLTAVAAYESRRPVLDGCEFAEQLQVVHIDGGVAGNVVPDQASVTINHRFAPDRTGDEAEASVRDLLGPTSWRRATGGSSSTRRRAHPRDSTIRSSPPWSRPAVLRPGPRWAGPTLPRSGAMGCPRPTSGPATRCWPTRRGRARLGGRRAPRRRLRARPPAASGPAGRVEP